MKKSFLVFVFIFFAFNAFARESRPSFFSKIESRIETALQQKECQWNKDLNIKNLWRDVIFVDHSDFYDFYSKNYLASRNIETIVSVNLNPDIHWYLQVQNGKNSESFHLLYNHFGEHANINCLTSKQACSNEISMLIGQLTTEVKKQLNLYFSERHYDPDHEHYVKYGEAACSFKILTGVQYEIDQQIKLENWYVELREKTAVENASITRPGDIYP